MWAMKEYGVKTSWHKEVVINQSISPDLVWLTWERVHLVEGLKDGSILMVYYEDKLLKYCPQRKTIEDVELFDRYFSGMAYRPGFLNFKALNQKLSSIFFLLQVIIMADHSFQPVTTETSSPVNGTFIASAFIDGSRSGIISNIYLLAVFSYQHHRICLSFSLEKNVDFKVIVKLMSDEIRRSLKS
ncbi:hypothetical protein E3N88_08833 [Mikania micrantha]|uniref:F-box associated domain-containing protein n=1 Tax=Mikania micrantha TaxID=192012 RepID=A0A5N6PIB1_9ASTR|nr:hypothetical protein E3N88_08833 [Mikania micrantha]